VLRKLLLFCIISLIATPLFSIKYNLKTYDGKPLILQTIFDFGFSAEAISDGIGITDYQSANFKTAFFVQDFGFGFDFKLRFRLLSGSVEFKTNDWYIENNPMETAFLYIDKIDYITYGNASMPFYLQIGDIPLTTFGSGFVVKNFHNYAFKPTAKEIGLYFSFNGFNLTLKNNNKVPVKLTFLMPDLVDPDIFAIDFYINPFFLVSHLKDDMSLNIGLSSTIDFNSDEPNRLNAKTKESITNHRNFYTNNSFQYTTKTFTGSFYVEFQWKNKYLGLVVGDEFAVGSELPSTVGLGNNLYATFKVINIEKSGFLLGINTGFVFEGANFAINSFASNSEVNRSKNNTKFKSKTTNDFMLLGGIGLYGLNEKIVFNLNALFVLRSTLYTKFYSEILLKEGLVPGLSLSIIYETGINELNTQGSNGGNFIRSITDGFRFSTRLDYKFFNAKIGLLIGIQAPASIQPYYLDVDNFDLNLSRYGNDLQKFISLETSIVF